jgi:hypothetical protein
MGTVSGRHNSPGPTSRPAQVGDISFERLSQRDSDNCRLGVSSGDCVMTGVMCQRLHSSASVNEVKGGMDAQH